MHPQPLVSDLALTGHGLRKGTLGQSPPLNLDEPGADRGRVMGRGGASASGGGPGLAHRKLRSSKALLTRQASGVLSMGRRLGGAAAGPHESHGLGAKMSRRNES